MKTIAGALLIALAGCAPSTSTRKQAVTGFPEPVLDLGTLSWFARVPFEAVFNNATSRPLTIRQVQSGCSCTTVERRLEGSTVDPGRSIVVRGQYLGYGRVGDIRERLWISDGDNQRYELQIHLHSMASFAMSPTSIDIGPADCMSGANTITRSITFGSHAVHIIGVPVCTAEWITAELSRIRDGEWRIDLSIHPDKMMWDQNVGLVSIQLANSDVNRVTIPVTGSRKCVLRAVPSEVYLRDDEVSRVRVYRADGLPVALAGIQGHHHSASAHIEAEDQLVVMPASATSQHEHREGTFEIVDQTGAKATILVAPVP